MSQCVPNWDLEDNPALAITARHSFRSNSTAPDVPMPDYEVAELTWENGQIAMHSLGPPKVAVKPISSTSPYKYTWDKQPRASGTLESIVNQATGLPCRKAAPFDCAVNNDDLVPWFDHHRTTASTASSASTTMDALVPCSNRSKERTTHLMESVPALGGTCGVGCSTRVASCSGPAASTHENNKNNVLRGAREARVPVAGEWSSKDQSVSASATFGSQQMSLDTYDKDLGRGFTSTYSLGSPENTTSGKSGTKNTIPDDHDSVCHSKPQREVDEEDKKKESGKCSVSTKRSRAAAIHNQSERKRRDKINQRMKTLQKLVPNSSKTDKASMLDEVIDYLKQLQAQVQVMSRMNMPTAMMLPISMQQQLQMSMMAPMGMGMGMGMGVMDMNTLGRPNMAGISPVMPNPFMPMASWESTAGDRGSQVQPSPVSVMPDPMSAFLACHPQPMTLDAYSKMAALYQQMQQPPASNCKS